MHSAREGIEVARISSALLRPRWSCAWILVALAVITAASSVAAEPPDADINPMIDVGFLVIRSTPDYDEALRVVRQASSSFEIPVDLRGLIYDPAHGLTRPRSDCELVDAWGGWYPCYLPRGRYDEGRYLSIDRSDAYKSFQPGYFVVIAASGEPGSREIEQTRQTVLNRFPDAYVRTDKVYFGCMH
jgi:hypothetical protein